MKRLNAEEVFAVILMAGVFVAVWLIVLTVAGKVLEHWHDKQHKVEQVVYTGRDIRHCMGKPGLWECILGEDRVINVPTEDAP